MSYRDFTFPQVCDDLGLTFQEQELFTDIEPVELPTELENQLDEGKEISLGINNEKARSEFIIAPLLLRIWGASGKRFGLFSGYELNVDASKGLNGVCDFLIAREPYRYMLRGPILAVVEAKNDNVANGFAQCVATMVAASRFNRNSQYAESPIYGASTTGIAWKFFRLVDSELTLDRKNYLFSDIGTIAAILFHIIGASPAPWPTLQLSGKK